MSPFVSRRSALSGNAGKLISAGLAAALCILPLQVQAASFKVELNQSRPLHLSAPASTIIVGNPAIADVSIQSAKVLYVLGRAYGKTNLIVLDAEGKQITEMDLNVTAASSDVVTLNRGTGQSTFNCTPRCERVATPGDDKDAFDTAMQQATSASGMGMGAAGSSANQ